MGRVSALWLSATPGLEDVAAEELAALAGGRAEPCPEGVPGQAFVHGVAAVDVTRLRAAHRARALVYVGPLATLDALPALLQGLPELIDALRSAEAFRVRCTRTGDHALTSEAIERLAGAALRQVELRPVRLTGAALEIQLAVRHNRLWVGYSLHNGTLSTRWHDTERRDVSLRASVAYALLALARCPSPPRVVFDPCMGAGTTLLEASVSWPEARLAGVELQPQFAAMAARNLERCSERAFVATGDARAVLSGSAGVIDLLVTNLPMGRRVGRALDLGVFTRELLRAARPWLSDEGRVVLLGRSPGLLARCVTPGYQRAHLRAIDLGGRTAGVLVLHAR